MIMASPFLKSICPGELRIVVNRNASDDDRSTEKIEVTKLEYQQAGPSQNTVAGVGQEKQPMTAAASSVPYWHE